MTRLRPLLPAALVLLIPLQSAPAQLRSLTTEDVWSAALLQGARAGYVHTRISQVRIGEEVRIHATMELNLAIRRFGRVIQLRMDTSTEETENGKVMAVSMKQYQNNQPQLTMKGIVKESGLELQVNGSSRIVPWNEKVLGLYEQENLLKKRAVKPGDRFSYLSFEPTITSVIRNQVVVKDYEEVNVPGKSRTRLLRVETIPDKIKASGAEVQLPVLMNWIDEKGVTQLSEFELPELGTLILFRTTEAIAKAPHNPSQLPTLTSRIPLNYSIDARSGEVVYRITVKGDDNPSSTFASDARQRASDVSGNTFLLHVSAYPVPKPNADKGGEIGAEYLKGCYYIDCDNARVKALAHQAVGDETDPWRQATLIEKWVHDNMRVSFTESFIPASAIATHLRGDCRQHAFLATAMCRAVGIPARTAIGLCYAQDPGNAPGMAFHMWTEVGIRGQWIGIDATRGQGRVGATHLKITDSSWSNIQSLEPLLPVIRVLGRLAIEVAGSD